MMSKLDVRNYAQNDSYLMDFVHQLNQLKKSFVRDIVYQLKNKIYPGGRNSQNTGQSTNLRNTDVLRQ